MIKYLKVVPIITVACLSLSLVYLGDYKYYAEVFANLFFLRPVCKGYGFGHVCQFCGLKYTKPNTEGCISRLHEVDWECASNSTHKYMGARCTFVCVSGGAECTQVESRRCFKDDTGANCANVYLYLQQFLRNNGAPANRRRLLSDAADTADTADTADAASAASEEPEPPKVTLFPWTLKYGHSIPCAVNNCGEHQCTYLIKGNGIADKVNNSVLYAKDDMLTCYCGKRHHHRLIVSDGALVSSCDVPKVLPHSYFVPNFLKMRENINVAYENHELCNTEYHKHQCLCPIGHYAVGNFFCAKQFDYFVPDRIVSTK